MKHFNLFILILFGISQLGIAQTVTFGDTDFKAYIVSLVDVAGGGNSDGEIQLTEAENVDEIFYQNKTWTNHTGLEAFTNLRDLYLDNTALGSTIDLSSLTNLKNLSLANTGISTVDLSTLVLLEDLTIRNNPLLTDLDVSELDLLEIFLVNDCGLTSLDLTKNTALTWLDVDGNALTSLNLRNGANAILTKMDATDNSLLECISVDDPTASAGYAEWTKDVAASYDYFCGEPFITTWETTSDNETITIPTYSGETYNYYVDWGDGSSSNLQAGNASHEYATAGPQTISIYGNFPRIYFNMGGDRFKIQTIEQWGDIEWTSMEVAFMGCLNLTSNAPDVPDLSQVASMGGMFAFDDAFDGDLSGWDVSNVQDMGNTFYGTALTSDISGWDVSNVTDMGQMLANVAEFAHDIGGWNVAKVTNMYGMLTNTAAFDHDLADWKVSLVTDMTYMFDGSGLSIENYMSTLDGWAGLSSLQSNVPLGANGLEYCPSSTGRNTLIDTYSWTISDDSPGVCPFDPTTMVQISDDGFKDYLLLVVDDNEDGQVQITEAEAHTGTISYTNEGLSDYTGLEYFTNINVLNLSGNSFSGIDLTNFEDLVSLNLSNGILNSVILPDAPLENIYLTNNNFESITISGYSTLEQLFLGGNDLTTLDVSNNPSLTRLSINSNDFVNWSDVNVSGTTGITLLEVQSNPLTDLDVSSLTALNQLYAQSTVITELDLSLNTQLTTVNISSAGGGTLTWVNIKNGNNATLTNFNVANHPDLDCILVDNVTASEGYAGWQKPSTARYTTDCEPIVTVNDPDFETYLLSQVDANADDLIQVSEAENFTGTISYRNRGESFTDATGLEAFINASVLYIDRNNLVDLDVSANTGLTRLIAYTNPFEGLDLSNNTALTEVIVGNSDLTTLNVSGLVELERLEVVNTLLSTLDIAGSTKLVDLILWNNELDELDVSKNVLLEDLRVYQNNLSQLNLSTNTALVELWAQDMTIDEIDLSNNTSLQTLYLDNNNLSSIDLRSNTALTGIYLMGNNLQEAYLNNGNNSNVPTSQFRIHNNSNLVCIQVDNVDYANTNWTNKDASAFYSTFCESLVAVNDAGLETYLLSLVDEGNGGNANGHIEQSEAENFSGSIVYRNKALVDATGLEAFVNITSLDLGVNDLNAYDPSVHPDLTALNLNLNNLSNIDVSTNIDLVDLRLANNSLMSIDLSNNVDLEVLYLFDNQIATLDLSALTILETLAVQDMIELTSLDVTNNVLIRQLEIYNTGITDIDLSSLTELWYLDIINTGIEFLDLSGKSKLEQLHADGSSLEYLNLKTGNHQLIDNLSLIGCANLTCVEVDDVAYAEANWTDIDEGLTFNTSCRDEQTITFGELVDKTYGDEPFALSATSTSNLTVDFSIVSGPATIDGNFLTITGAGEIIVAADQSGDADYDPADQVTQSFIVSKADQIITISDIDNQSSTAAPIEVSATVNSGLPLNYDVSGPATISGSKITLSGEVGTVTLTVSQAGNDNYNPASASISFEVSLPLAVAPSSSEILVYPNPATEWLMIGGTNQSEAQIKILDMRGKVLKHVNVITEERINVSGLKSGYYFLRIDQKELTTTTKILIHR